MAFRTTALGELAASLGREVEGDADLAVRGVASLEGAGPGDLAFVRSRSYAAALGRSRAGAVIAPAGVDTGGRPTIRSPRPDLDFARAVSLLAERERPPPGIHPTASVAADAHVHPTASIGPQVVIGARSRVGAHTVVRAHAVLYEDVRVGAECTLHAGCHLREGVVLGDRVWVDPGAVIGAEGFGFAFDEEGHPLRVPQIGGVVIEDDAEIGANTTIQRGTLEPTRIRRNAKVDCLCIVSHNCDVGEDVLMVGQSGLAGHTVLERGVILMGQTGTAGHQRLGAGSFVGARSGVVGDLPARSRVWGTPAWPARRWHRSMAALARLPDALRRLRAVERRLGLGPKPEGEEET